MDDLPALFRTTVIDRLTADGWTAQSTADLGTWNVANLTWPANEQGVGLAVSIVRGRVGGGPAWSAGAEVSLVYEPAAGLAALVEQPLHVVEVDDQDGSIRVATADDIEVAADEVVSWCDAWSTEHRDDTLADVLDRIEEDEDFDEDDSETVRLLADIEADEGHRRRALLMAASGQVDAARDELAEVDTQLGRDRLVVHRLGQWLDGDRVLPPAPADPVEPRTLILLPATLDLAESRRRAKARAEAIERVRNGAAGRSWDEVRAMLAEALEEGNAGWDSFLMLEVAVGRVRRPRPSGLARLRRAAHGVRELGETIRSVGGDDPVTSRSTPEHVRPPLLACYDVGTGIGDAPVVLDDDASDRLEELVAASKPTADGRFATVEGWLTWADDTHTDLEVHIGDRVVGALVGDAAALYHGAMAASAEHGEVPCLSLSIGLLDDGQRWVVAAVLPASAGDGTDEVQPLKPLTRPTAAEVGAVVRSMFPSRPPRPEADG